MWLVQREKRSVQGLGRNLNERWQLEDLGIDGRIILKQTFRKQNGTA